MSHEQAKQLAEEVRVYLDWLEQNRDPNAELEDRVTAKEQMALCEDKLRELSGWTSSRGKDKR